MMKKLWNRKILGYIALAVACVMIGSVAAAGRPAQAADSVMTASSSSPFVEPIAKVKNSVVGVNNYQLVSNRYDNYGGYGNFFPWGDFFGYGNGGSNGYGNGNQDSGREVKYGSGSGVVVAKEYVLTNYHVVEDASSLEVAVIRDGQSDPELLKATVAASDSDLDVAVLYVPGLDLEPVELGDSDTLQAFFVASGQKKSGNLRQRKDVPLLKASGREGLLHFSFFRSSCGSPFPFYSEISLTPSAAFRRRPA